MKRKYKKYTNLYMRYLKALHKGCAYYTTQINGKYTIPVRDAMHFGSWHILNNRKMLFGNEIVKEYLGEV